MEGQRLRRSTDPTDADVVLGYVDIRQLVTRPGVQVLVFATAKLGFAVVTLSFVAAVFVGRQARAEGDVPGEPRLFLRLATGPAFNYESWSPVRRQPRASYTGWAPVLDVAVGRRVRPRLVIAGDLQLATVVNRTESYLGGSYPLTDTLHFLDSLSAIADYTLWRHPRFHCGGGLGLLVTTDVDTHMGSTATNLGFALSVHAGIAAALARAWSIGVMGRLTFYRFGSHTPPPSASSIGLLPVLLLTFTR